MSPDTRFKNLLRELFQFAKSDLDFGIYRVMNQKRAELEEFIDKRIVAEVDLALATPDNGGKGQDIIESGRTVIKTMLGDSAFDARGELLPDFRNIPFGHAWRALVEIGGKPPPPPATLRKDVFNRLYDFFSRYYDDGDFICKQRYAADGRYAVPYNGEEVLLHWANKDQYYIKTAEQFACYTFRIPSGEVNFVISEAELEKDNNKNSDKRYFFPLIDKLTETKIEKRTVYELPFEYRAPTKKEVTLYGKNGNGNGAQAKIIDAAMKNKDIPPPLLTEENGKTLLKKHIDRYTKQHTADYFIHKNLHRFLRNELECFITRELLNAEEMLRDNANTRARFATLRAVRQAALLTIDFLAQLEDFQKALWEKKKFITETQYCVTVGTLATNESLLSKIADCDKQWQEWHSLGFCDKSLLKATVDKRLEFVKSHPTLTVDTANFSPAFKENLLANFDDLEEMIDGVLFHGENWQALSLMQEKYRGRVKCMYIDPPYNTGGEDFLFKDSYQHSSWLSMMNDRFNNAYPMTSTDGVIFTSIDDNEFFHLQKLMKQIFGEDYIESFIWRKSDDGRYGKMKNTNTARKDHEYLVVGYKSDVKLNKIMVLPYFSTKPKKDSMGEWWSGYIARGKKGSNPEHANYYTVVSPGGIEFSAQFEVTKEQFETLDQRGHIHWSETGVPYRKVYKHEPRLVVASSIFSDTQTTYEGNWFIEDIFGERAFPNPKPIRLIERIISLGEDSVGKNDNVLDYFAGSGTTAHAVINLNREDGGRRKFILAEMGEHFNTVLLPRIKKVTFTPEWKDGKPKREATAEEAERAPRIIKYHRYESYDDSLENIQFDDERGRVMKNMFSDYVPRYMLKTESRHCATFADTDSLKSPFNYTLRRVNADNAEADLPETFAYLIGLREKTRRIYHNKKCCYVVQRGEADGKDTVVIWRDTAKWQTKDFERDRDFIASQVLTDGAQRVFINDDSLVPDAESLTPIFAERMFGGGDE